MKLNRFIRRTVDEDGNSTVEFVLVVPVFILLFVSIFELGMAMTRMTMLEHGLDVVMRDIRLSTNTTFTAPQIRTAVCNQASVLKACEQNLEIEMQVVDSTNWAMPSDVATCQDITTTADPVTTFQNGTQNDVMFIRACYAVQPLFPSLGLGATLARDDSGAMYLVAASAFSQEPD